VEGQGVLGGSKAGETTTGLVLGETTGLVLALGGLAFGGVAGAGGLTGGM